MSKSNNLAALHEKLENHHDKQIVLVFNREEYLAYYTHVLEIGDQAEWVDSCMGRADFHLITSPSISVIYMNEELFGDMSERLLTNILCHEIGHIISEMQPPSAAEGVIPFEKAANDFGIELYAEYYPRETYYNNHEDAERMERSKKMYSGEIESVKGTQLMGVE